VKDFGLKLSSLVRTTAGFGRRAPLADTVKCALGGAVLSTDSTPTNWRGCSLIIPLFQTTSLSFTPASELGLAVIQLTFAQELNLKIFTTWTLKEGELTERESEAPQLN
jgi:hypothetical protein